MKKIVSTFCFVLVTVSTFATINPLSIGINEDNRHKFTNDYVSAKFDETTTNLELTFKKNSDAMDVLIYKNGKVCEKERLQNVSKDDTEVYRLSDYGTGIYTICTGENRNIQILGTVVCDEK